MKFKNYTIGLIIVLGLITMSYYLFFKGESYVQIYLNYETRVDNKFDLKITLDNVLLIDTVLSGGALPYFMLSDKYIDKGIYSLKIISTKEPVLNHSEKVVFFGSQHYVKIIVYKNELNKREEEIIFYNA